MLNFLKKFKEIKFKYLFFNSYVRCLSSSTINIGKKVKIKNSKILVTGNSNVIIGDKATIKNLYIVVHNGNLHIKEFTILGNWKYPSEIKIEKGTVHIDHHSKSECKRIWVRFDGRLTIGSYTNINEGSEIRCNSKIDIGSYNQISYNVRIWDNNTHNILPLPERHKLTESNYPGFGLELSSSPSSSISIGSDCWIGENAAIMKGCKIGDEVVIGFGTFLSGKSIPSKNIVHNKVDLVIKPY